MPQKKRNKFRWIVESKWDDFDEVLDFLESAGYVNFDSSDLKCGQKFYFRCKRIPKERKTWCAKRYTIFLPSNSMEILLLCNGHDHDHDKLLEGTIQPPSDEMTLFIEDLFVCNTFKYCDVILHIEQAREKRGLYSSEVNPQKNHVQNLLRKFRSKQVPPIIKLGDLSEWCNQYTDFPSDENDAFVIGIECSSIEEGLSFRFAFSTPLLLKILMNQTTICIDATYKLNWLGFPLMVLGTVDRTKRFHPLVYACCSHERTLDYRFIFTCAKTAIKAHFDKEFEPEKLIADAADPIRNAYYDSYESAKLDIMCYAHVIRNCRKRPFSSKNNKMLILDDIRKMQLSPNRPTFNMMAKLFCSKWNSVEPDFVVYFQKEWLGVHSNWFEGAADYTASTNNGQESHNAVIKKKITLRRRLPMNQFLNCMKTMTQDISIQFSKAEREITQEPNIKRDVYESAAKMVMNNFKAFKAKQPNYSDVLIYSIPSSGCVDASETYYKTLVKAIWRSFDEFIVHGYQQFYIVKFSLNSWKTESTCTCAAFFKQHMCKHIIAIGIRLEIIEIPDNANPVLLAPTKRKAGRPKNAATALIVQ